MVGQGLDKVCNWTDVGQTLDRHWTKIGLDVQSLSNQPSAKSTEMRTSYGPKTAENWRRNAIFGVVSPEGPDHFSAPSRPMWLNIKGLVGDVGAMCGASLGESG